MGKYGYGILFFCISLSMITLHFLGTQHAIDTFLGDHVHHGGSSSAFTSNLEVDRLRKEIARLEDVRFRLIERAKITHVLQNTTADKIERLQRRAKNFGE